jgi:chromosome segregation ATPase
MENTEGEELEPLAAAYEQRTKEVHEARGALGEAVWALRLELEQRREEATALRRDNSELRQYAESLTTDHRKLHEHAQNLTNEIDRLRERVGVLEGELRSAHDLIDVLRNMKVVRWTAWPRRIVYRLRDRHR